MYIENGCRKFQLKANQIFVYESSKTESVPLGF